MNEMTAYIESSCLLRRLFDEPNSLVDWGAWTRSITSQITRVESLRTLDRARLIGRITHQDFVEKIADLNEMLGEIDEIQLTPHILAKASQPYPAPIGTLDAIHLASTLLWQEHRQKEILLLTHDTQLGRTALAMGIKARGF